jgi:hypothetical protein
MSSGVVRYRQFLRTSSSTPVLAGVARALVPCPEGLEPLAAVAAQRQGPGALELRQHAAGQRRGLRPFA